MTFKEYKEIAKSAGVGGDRMDLKQGDNKIRIVSEFLPFSTHYYSKEENKNPTTCIGKAKKCSGCVGGNKSKVQFLGWVIDRVDSVIKPFYMGYSIFSQIGVLANNDQFGFEGLPPYDMTINKTGEGLETKYNVIGDRKNIDLTNDEKLDIDENVKDPEEMIDEKKAREIGIIETSEEKEIDTKDIPF